MVQKLCHMTGQPCTCNAPQLCLPCVQITGRGRRLVTFDNGPDVAVVLEPDGFFRAIDQNTYDVDCDQDGFFSNSPTGYGRTPLDAIVDLLDTIDVRTAT